MKETGFIPEQHSKLRATNARRVLQHDIERRLQLAGGAGDDTQHLGRSVLALYCFV